jgi:hypothetical protein
LRLRVGVAVVILTLAYVSWALAVATALRRHLRGTPGPQRGGRRDRA